MTSTTQQPAMTHELIAAEPLAAFREHFAGPLILPNDARYDAARSIWNGMIDKRPALIAQAAGMADVIAAVGFAQERGLELGVRGGGHNVAGHAVPEGGLLLDLSSMRAVSVDPVRRTARVQGGATWADVDRETQVFGLATTGGVVSTTGVAGLTLGGGIGWLVAKHGMSIDNLLSVELVTAGGDVITASAHEHPELFWALRGGGGNFGVATAFEFQLHPLTTVFSATFAFPASDGRALLDLYRELTANLSDELMAYFFYVTEPESGELLAVIETTYLGAPEDGEALIAPLRRFGTPLLEEVTPMPYITKQAASDVFFPSGLRYYWKANLFEALSDSTLDAIHEYGSQPASPETIVAIENYHGAFNRVAPDATAYPHRDVHYQLVISSAWQHAEDDAAGIAYARELYAATRADAKDGQFLNFNSLEGAESTERIPAGYGPNWARLREIKRHYDPTNVFHGNSNIPPAE